MPHVAALVEGGRGTASVAAATPSIWIASSSIRRPRRVIRASRAASMR
jgi:hypothetical protein